MGKFVNLLLVSFSLLLGRGGSSGTAFARHYFVCCGKARCLTWWNMRGFSRNDTMFTHELRLPRTYAT